MTSRLPMIGLVLVLLCGAALRLVWVDDMEYKADEQWTFRQTQEVLAPAGDPSQFGMRTSLGFVNPPMSMWVFVAPAVLFKIRDPLVLVRVVQISNVVAIALLLVFAWRMVPPEETEPWAWGAALAAVNPFSVMFGRKIWAQSTLPLFLMLTLLAWWRRERWYGAFLWGLVGALTGQIHLAAFFAFAGFVLWAVLFDQRGVRWLWCVAGAAIGTLPMVSWIEHVFIERHIRMGQAIDPGNVLRLDFWKLWITEPLGLGLQYSLGGHFARFLEFPVIGRHRTWLVLLVHVASGAIGLTLCVRGFWWRVQERRLSDLLPGKTTRTSFTLSAAFWGFGLILSLPGLPVHRFYLISAFPLTFVWLAWLALPDCRAVGRSLTWQRRLLLPLLVAELALTTMYLYYIRVNGGAPGADYGVVYRLQ